MKPGHVMRWWSFSLRSLTLLAVISSAGAATNVVTSLADSGPGSLRQAISNALRGDTITFALNGTIVLTSGELLMRTNLHILGPGADNLAVSGNNSSRVFNISLGVTSSISGLTVRDGRTSNGFNGTNGVNAPNLLSNGSPGGSSADGGGIYNRGALTMSNCVILGNRTGDGGNGGNVEVVVLAVVVSGTKLVPSQHPIVHLVETSVATMRTILTLLFLGW